MNTLIAGSLAAMASASGMAAVAQTQAAASRPPTALAGACARLGDYHAPGLEITGATFEQAGALNLPSPPGATRAPLLLPAHCLVAGVIDKRIGVGGKPYGIHFEMRLPEAWNHRFLFEGGGGTNGVVAPAVGLVKGPPALTRGFAVVTQDAGHTGGDSSFGEDQQARIDMIYRSYDRVTAVAKQLVAGFYGQPPEHSYFMGCSEGGREALMVSQRQPLDFDGVVAGDPGFNLGVEFHTTTERMIIADLRRQMPAGGPVPSKPFSDADIQLIETTIETDCDAKDGLKDGIIDNPAACRPNLERLICAGDKIDGCLTAPQVAALRAIYGGGRPTGAGIVSYGYFYDTGVDTFLWKAKLNGGGGLASRGVSSVQGLYSTPYDPTFDENSIDFVHGGGDRFEEVGALNRADGVMYSTFKQRGGKLLIYTGQSDPAFSAKTLLAYFDRLAANNGGPTATADFARLFIAPGMTHCGGGKSLDDFDPLQSVVDWVEKGQAPVAMIATGKAFPGRSRPLCVWPLQSRYKGAGSIEDAANFACRAATPPDKTSS